MVCIDAVVVPEVLTHLRELPLFAQLVAVVAGLFLWTTGWGGHRFWIVLGATLGAGIVGLRHGPDFGAQPIVAGLLAAVAAGCLALSLARVAIFVACGFGCWYAAQMLTPNLSVPLVCLLIGGLLGLLLFRFWIILLSSTAGVVLLSCGGLVLTERLLKVDPLRWVSGNGTLINLGLAVAVLIGVVFQYYFVRVHKRFKSWSKAPRDYLDQRDENHRRWFQRLRKAG